MIKIVNEGERDELLETIVAFPEVTPDQAQDIANDVRIVVALALDEELVIGITGEELARRVKDRLRIRQ